MCLVDGQIVLLEIERDNVNRFASPIADVLYIERGKELLYSWVNIQTLSGAISIKFNTANDHLFDPAIEQIRQGMSDVPFLDMAWGKNEQESAKFDYLSNVNYKYMNYGRKSIRSGDTVAAVAYEPERCIQEFTLFNKTLFRRYNTSHLSILTAKEFILIKENKQIKTDKESMHGGVFTYIPRHRIQGISFNPNAENTQAIMEITLPDNVYFTSEFSLDNEELPAFQQKCRDIRV